MGGKLFFTKNSGLQKQSPYYVASGAAQGAAERARLVLDPNEISKDEAGRLVRAIRAALRTGIARQGSTLSDYRTPDGASGSMQDDFRVYGRDGEPCPRCRTTITKTRVGGRGTWFCPRCQPLQ